MGVVKVENLGSIFEKERHAELSADDIYYTIVEDAETHQRIAYLSHFGGRGGRNPNHEHSWASTARHLLVSEDPLHLEPSIGWQACCGRHGFIRNGVWEPTSDSLEP